MSTVVIYESMFGNTAAIAQSIGEGIAGSGGTVRVLEVADAPAALPEDVTLLVIGAPTHSMALPTDASRQKARSMEAVALSDASVRAWLTGRHLRPGLEVAVFDTSTGGFFSLFGTAATSMRRMIVRGGHKGPVQLRSFRVRGTKGPVQDGQLEAARAWGAALAESGQPKVG